MRGDGPLVLRLLGYVAEHAVEWTVGILRTWMRWFWRLRPLPKLVALALHIIAVNVVTSWLGSGASASQFVVTGAALALVFLTVASLLFGSTGP